MALAEYTLAFLRMAAVELRRLAERTPEIAVELRDLAGDFEENAIELEHDDETG
jgi:hypothetical protein